MLSGRYGRNREFNRMTLYMAAVLWRAPPIVRGTILGTGLAGTKLWRVTPHNVGARNRTEHSDPGESRGEGSKMRREEGEIMELTFSEKKLTLTNILECNGMWCKINKM